LALPFPAFLFPVPGPFLERTPPSMVFSHIRSLRWVRSSPVSFFRTSRARLGPGPSTLTVSGLIRRSRPLTLLGTCSFACKLTRSPSAGIKKKIWGGALVFEWRFLQRTRHLARIRNRRGTATASIRASFRPASRSFEKTAVFACSPAKTIEQLGSRHTVSGLWLKPSRLAGPHDSV